MKMFFLEIPLVQPEYGLMFWMLVVFLIVMFLLKKYAWGPILKMLKDRETLIEESLNKAAKAKEEIKDLQATNEKMLNEARAERDAMMKEARETRESIVNEAKNKAKVEADRMIAIAREQIQNEKMAAITDLKNQVASLSIEIAEKILKENLSKDENQKSLVNNYIKDINLN
ncbi:MAG: F0F1 ATP synthase subunit B [Bacteroidota bacterium]|jgi:F-type H+-transporting ATPase subunit b